MKNNLHTIHEHSHTSLDDEEVRGWRRKLLGAWIFTVPIVVLMILTRLNIELFSEEIMVLISLLLAFPVIFIFGWQTIQGGLRGFFTFYFNMDSLIALG